MCAERSSAERRRTGLNGLQRTHASLELAGDSSCVFPTAPTIFKHSVGDPFLATSVSPPCPCMPVANLDEGRRRMVPKFIRLSIGQENNIPPLMSMFAPVTKAAPSEAR